MRVIPYILGRLKNTYSFPGFIYIANSKLYIILHVVSRLEGTSNYLVFK